MYCIYDIVYTFDQIKHKLHLLTDKFSPKIKKTKPVPVLERSKSTMYEFRKNFFKLKNIT